MLEKVQEDRAKNSRPCATWESIPTGPPTGHDARSSWPVAKVLADFEKWEKGNGGPEQAKNAKPLEFDAAGRIVLVRDMGKMMFAQIRDASGPCRSHSERARTGKPPAGLGDRSALAKLLDLGDIIAVKGELRPHADGRDHHLGRQADADDQEP